MGCVDAETALIRGAGDEDLLRDPYPYFDYLRAQCPVHQERRPGLPLEFDAA